MLKILQILTCFSIFVGFLLSYLDRQNAIVRYKLRIPVIEKEIEKITLKNQEIKTLIDRFEHPKELMSYLKKEEFAHLRPYLDKDIVCLKEAEALNREEKKEPSYRKPSSISIASGVSYR